MEIIPVPAFLDNYIWLMKDEASSNVAVVDPGEAKGVLEEAERRGWAITQIWNTHWHPDHTGGNLAIKEATGARILGPAGEPIPGRDIGLVEGDSVRLGSHIGRVIEIPGHTLGHIAFLFDADDVAFVGDTLFAMGCGRLFEGSPQQMHRSLKRLAELPGEMRVYCAHEYTLANARFAVHAEPRNRAINDRMREVKRLREQGKITLPTTVSLELETNPFVRATNKDELARLRLEKDSFRS